MRIELLLQLIAKRKAWPLQFTLVVLGGHQYDPSHGTLPTIGSDAIVLDKLYEDSSIDGFEKDGASGNYVRKNDTDERSDSDIISSPRF